MSDRPTNRGGDRAPTALLILRIAGTSVFDLSDSALFDEHLELAVRLAMPDDAIVVREDREEAATVALGRAGKYGRTRLAFRCAHPPGTLVALGDGAAKPGVAALVGRNEDGSYSAVSIYAGLTTVAEGGFRVLDESAAGVVVEDGAVEEVAGDEGLFPEYLDPDGEGARDDDDDLPARAATKRYVLLTKEGMTALLVLGLCDENSYIIRHDPREMLPAVQNYADERAARRWFRRSVETSVRNGWAVVYEGARLSDDGDDSPDWWQPGGENS